MKTHRCRRTGWSPERQRIAIVGTVAAAARIFFVAAAVIVSTPAPAGQDAGPCSTPTDARAVQRLKDKVRSDRLYSSWSREQCLWFDPEDCDRRRVDVAIHEIHDERCGGDPATSPVVDRFRVFKNSKRIDWYDFVDGEYVDYSKVRSVGGR